MPKIISNKQARLIFSRLFADRGIKHLISRVYEKFPEAELFLVGGIVRDVFMGRSEKGDLDFVVRNIEPPALKKILSGYGKVNLVGKNFGVFKFKSRTDKNKKFIDFALPRTEHALGTGAYRDFKVQSNPSLPLKNDLGRRDFTINALAWNLKSNTLIDYFNGVNDLRAGIIRAVGNPKERFTEDFSRMLRALRIATELDFSIESRTWHALKKLIRLINKKKNGTFIVPRETIAKEFLKSFHAHPLNAFEWWAQGGAMHQLIPEIIELRLCPQPSAYHAEGNAYTHVRLVLEVLSSDEFKQEFKQKHIPLYVCLGLLFHDIAKLKTLALKSPKRGHISFPRHAEIGAKMCRKIAKRIKLESYKSEGIDIEAGKLAWLVKQHMFILGNDPKSVPLSTIEQYFMQPVFPRDYLLQIGYCDIKGSKMGAPIANLYELNYYGYKEKIRQINRRFSRGLPGRILDGEEIQKILKIKPGPKIARILLALRDEQLAGKIKTKKQAAAFIKNNF